MSERPQRIWLLQLHQEVALKQIWATLLKLFGYEIHIPMADVAVAKGIISSYRRKSRSSLIVPSTKDTTSLSSSSSLLIFQSTDLKIRKLYISLETGAYDENDTLLLYHQEDHPLLSKYVPEELHRSLWACTRNDLPDNWLLRFMRVSNFDFKTSLSWIAENCDWRVNKYPIDDWFYRGDGEMYLQSEHKRLIERLKAFEVYIKGRTKSGCPLVFIRAKDHFRSNCADEEYERLIVLHFEWIRLFLAEFKKGTDQAHVLFDLTGFTLKNGDFHAVKFAVKSFQRYYPDMVERIYIHNAPKIFSIFWNIIVKWMKPHLKDKFIFTYSVDALLKYIDPEHIPKLIGTPDLHKCIPQYVEPTQSNSLRKEPDGLFENLMKQRDELTIKFINSTIKWIEARTPEESRGHLDNKIRIGKARAQNYVFLDPYLRKSSPYDRNGELSIISY